MELNIGYRSSVARKIKAITYTIRTNRVLILLAICLGLASQVKAQVNTFSHLLEYNPDLRSFQRSAIAQMGDQSYVFCRGVAEPDSAAYSSNVEIIRTNAAGHLVWAKSIYNGIHQFQYTHNSVAKTPTAAVLLGTTIFLNPDKPMAGLIKLGTGGDLKWAKLFAGEGSAFFNCVISDAANNYIACGSTTLQDSIACAFIVKTDSSGAVLWQKTIRFSGDTVASHHDSTASFFSCREVPGEGYVFAGRLINQGAMIKLDYNGNLIWDVESFIEGNFENVVQLSDGSYIVSGWTDYPGLSARGFCKVSAVGTVTDSKELIPGSGPYFASYMWELTAGNAGEWTFSSYVQSPVPYIVIGKVNAADGIIWAKRYQTGVQPFNYLPSCLLNTIDGGYVLYNPLVGTYAGSVNTYSGSFHKLDNNGAVNCDGTNYSVSLGQLGSGYAWNNIYMYNSTLLPSSFVPSLISITIKDSLICENIAGPAGLSAASVLLAQSAAFPNPFKTNTTITYTLGKEPSSLEFELTDLNGRLLLHKSIPAAVTGYNTLSLDYELEAGIYFYSLIADGLRTSGKLIVEK